MRTSTEVCIFWLGILSGISTRFYRYDHSEGLQARALVPGNTMTRIHVS